MLDASQAVATVVRDHSACAVVFQRHRIDFCCQGDRSVAAAAAERGVALPALIAQLEQAIEARQDEAAGAVSELSTDALLDLIVTRHHGYLREALPFARGLAAKVARVHGDHNPKLRQLDAAVSVLAAALLQHIDDEENELFRALRASPAEADEALLSALAAMRAEHLIVAKMLEDIRSAADDFSLPEWACRSYRALFDELSALETDTFRHVHLENHVLAPRFRLVVGGRTS